MLFLYFYIAFLHITTLTDSFAVGCDQYMQPNGSLGTTDLGLYYVYKYDTVSMAGERTYEVTSPDTINIDGRGIVVSQNLENGGERLTIKNHRGFLQFKACVKNSNYYGGSTNAVAFYIHQKYVVNVALSFNFESIVSGSVSLGTKYQLMSPNPYVPFLISE